jgi:hypothetical protein
MKISPIHIKQQIYAKMSCQMDVGSANIIFLWLKCQFLPWRGGRVVEGAALEMLFRAT